MKAPFKVLSIAAFTFGTAATTPAFARSIPASYALPYADPCFSNGGGPITNNCPDYANLEFPLSMDASGWVSATVHAWAPDAAHNVCCIAESMVEEGGGAWIGWRRSSEICLSMPRLNTTLTVTWYAPSNSASHVYCSVGQEARVNFIEW